MFSKQFLTNSRQEGRQLMFERQNDVHLITITPYLQPS